MGIDNVIAGHGFGIAFTGMVVVFAGLVLVSLFIMALPKAFELAGRRGQPRPPRMQAADEGVMGRELSLDIDPDLLAAIGFVLQSEWERQLASDDQRITLKDDEEQQVWTAIGKMRTLATRM
jgi:hypothetical protein